MNFKSRKFKILFIEDDDTLEESLNNWNILRHTIDHFWSLIKKNYRRDYVHVDSVVEMANFISNDILNRNKLMVQFMENNKGCKLNKRTFVNYFKRINKSYHITNEKIEIFIINYMDGIKDKLIEKCKRNLFSGTMDDEKILVLWDNISQHKKMLSKKAFLSFMCPSTRIHAKHLLNLMAENGIKRKIRFNQFIQLFC
jgi:hypothetical protein